MTSYRVHASIFDPKMKSLALRLLWQWLLLMLMSMHQCTPATAVMAAHHHTSSKNDVIFNATPQRPAFTCPQTIGLPLGDINILVVTDIHGWIAGQHARHEPHLNVDMGDLISFYERLKECTAARSMKKRDWFLMFNGDFMDGTGLSTVPPTYLLPLLQAVPFSALNVGNHELYENEVVDMMMSTPALTSNSIDTREEPSFVSHWLGTYLASNVDYIVANSTNSNNDKSQQHHSNQTTTTTTVPLGSRYSFLNAPRTNATILTFGFLYNFENNCNHTIVRQVETVLEESWFVQVLTRPPQPYQAIVVLAHMDAVDPLVYTILQGIRTYVGEKVPIQFLTGHSHRRHYERLDDRATSLEAGRFMDTIGFASFSLPPPGVGDDLDVDEDGTMTDTTTTPSSSQQLFHHVFLDANKRDLLMGPLNSSDPTVDFSTLHGRLLTQRLKRAQKELGLDAIVTKCAPHDFALEKPIDDPNSLWGLYMNQVIPTTFFPRIEKKQQHYRNHHNSTTTIGFPIFMQGTGGLRYDLFSPVVVVDDIIAVSPFENPIYKVGHKLTTVQLYDVFDALNVDEINPKWAAVGLVNYGIAGERPSRPSSTTEDDDDGKRYDLYTVSFHVAEVYPLVVNATGSTAFPPKPIMEKHSKKQLDTSKMWFEFVRKQWKCHHEPDALNRSHEILTQQVAPLSLAFEGGDLDTTPIFRKTISAGRGNPGFTVTIDIMTVALVSSAAFYGICFRLARIKLQVLHQLQPQMTTKKLLILSVLLVSVLRIMTILGVAAMNVANVRAHYSLQPSRHSNGDKTQDFYDEGTFDCVCFVLPALNPLKGYRQALQQHCCIGQT